MTFRPDFILITWPELQFQCRSISCWAQWNEWSLLPLLVIILAETDNKNMQLMLAASHLQLAVKMTNRCCQLQLINADCVQRMFSVSANVPSSNRWLSWRLTERIDPSSLSNDILLPSLSCECGLSSKWSFITADVLIFQSWKSTWST